MPDAPLDKSQSYFPLAGGASDGWSNGQEATATCFCGAVQLKFPTRAPGLVFTFICNCTDCRKITASMFASNFTVLDTHLTHLRGRENLTSFSQSHTIASGNTMTNYFCSTCGTLMYRVSSGFPGTSVLRLGTVDDFHLHETKLKPRVEQFTENRVAWLHGAEGVKQVAKSRM
ncbi:putative glutathione-dependent formaldehyde-activating gfa [Mycena sanguinolenta]|uniref:Putative glutathione-dependent formaldehyde-activating gfa n=1 Tax=Mycena sanguinolenta TaxID=230812 RepID=A0A8H6Y5U5_9AGAR|nr:putative glutathione-dependent formaldehyde-activating gfa [Mycena sanguinolenta]